MSLTLPLVAPLSLGGWASAFVHHLSDSFNPASLSGLSLWLRGDTGLFEDAAGSIAATNDTDPIGRWADADDATRYASQATTAAKPTLDLASVGSQDAAYFDGGDHLATATAILSGATEWEMWGVGQVAASTDAWTLTASRNAGDNTNAFFIYSPAGANYLRGLLNGTVASFTDLVLPAGSPFIARVWFDGTTIRGALNGATSAITATPSGNVNALPKYIGALNDGGTASAHTIGHIAELAAYSQNPASADVGELWDYFAGRYGVTLP